MASSTRTTTMAFSETEQTTISPHNQQAYVTRQYPSSTELDAQIDKAAAAQKAWARVPLKQRIEIGRRFMVRTSVCLGTPG